MEELTKKELLDYLEEISQQLNNIALDQIPFAISELYFKLENSISISVIEKKIEELEDIKIKTQRLYPHTYTAIGEWLEAHYKIKILQEILNERSNNDDT